MRHVFGFFIILQMCIFHCDSEWVKISQTNDKFKNETAISGHEQSEARESSEPSPEWIEYQKERFKGSNYSQKLIVSGESHLKTSAEIVVPAQVINESNKAQRNKILQAKTKLSLQQSPADITPITSTESTSKKAHKKRPVKEDDNGLEFPSFMGFLNFLTSLQSGLLKKNSFGIMEKIKMLKSMRDQLMWNIESSFGTMFPKSRQKRGITDESSFQFPSETALMSISFLTFSVFLIKLVLQVIQIIKSKHYTYNGMAMNNVKAMVNSRMNARSFDASNEDLDVLTKVSAAIKMNPFGIK